MKRFWNKLNQKLDSKSSVLSAWASILQIIVFPTILLTLILGYFQLRDYFLKADLLLTFSNPKSLTYTIVNEGKATAEKPSYGFGIFDLDKKPIDTVPIPWEETSYLRPKTAQGPNTLLGNYGKSGHRYFGFASISCKNCVKERWYWIYVIHGRDKEAWYVELGKDEPKIWNPIVLMNNPEFYIEKQFPKYKRISIK